MNTPRRQRRPDRPAFTLVELLVVIVIIILVSVASLPAILPALNNRRVSEGSRVFQAVLAGVRDQAIRANEPRGIRLLPDPVLNTPAQLAANRMVAIEPAPDYSEGAISIGGDPAQVAAAGNPLATSVAPFLPFQPAAADTSSTPTSYVVVNGTDPRLRVLQAATMPTVGVPAGIPNAPTGWYYNLRQGDKILIGDTGRYYTIAGPMTRGPGAGNVERYINYDPNFSSSNPNSTPPATAPYPTPPETLLLVNGQDDDGDGWIDEGFDGIDNDGDGVIDPGFNGIDDDKDGQVDEIDELFFAANGFPMGGEYEQEQFLAAQLTSAQGSGFFTSQPYLVKRRPVISPQAKEVLLPDGVVIDLTTWNAPSITPSTGATLPERSRVPVDPFTLSVDIMLSPSGQVIQAGAGQASGEMNSLSPTSNMPFYHFWITDRTDVFPANMWGDPQAQFAQPGNANSPILSQVPRPNPSSTANPAQYYLLPMPEGTTSTTGGAAYTGGPTGDRFLKGERRLVTLFARTGQITSTRIELFDSSDTSRPYYDAQIGLKEEQ